MANSHETLTGLFTDIADAIRSKSGSSEPIVADNFPGAISSISTSENLDAELATQDSLIAQITAAVEGKAGVTLPVLSNPAGAENIESGYQAIDGSGNLIEGAMAPTNYNGARAFNQKSSIIAYKDNVFTLASSINFNNYKNVLFFGLSATRHYDGSEVPIIADLSNLTQGESLTINPDFGQYWGQPTLKFEKLEMGISLTATGNNFEIFSNTYGFTILFK